MSITTTKIIYNGEIKIQSRNLDAEQVFNIYKQKYSALADTGTYDVTVDGNVKTITIRTRVGQKG